jgi:hypothetical protein
MNRALSDGAARTSSISAENSRSHGRSTVLPKKTHVEKGMQCYSLEKKLDERYLKVFATAK